MSGGVRGGADPKSREAAGSEITHGTVAMTAAKAIIQARLVVRELREAVLPALPPSRRAMIGRLIRRLEHDDLFEEILLGELEALADFLYGLVAAGTKVSWEPIEGHVRGGCEVLQYEPRIAELDRACDELQLLHQLILTTRAAARALRELDRLIET